MKKTLAAALLAAFASAAASAAQWPADKPVRIVHGFSSAAATQVLAQEIAERLHAETGASVYVEPRPGAGGNIGADVVAKAPPDGYTLYVATSATQAINPLIYSKLPFDTQKDFAPITLLGDIPNVLIVNKDLPVKTLADFVALAKSRPGQLHYGSSGNGTSMHLAAEQFKMAAGVDVQHVPYRSSGTAVTDLMGGQIQAMFHQVPAVIGMIRSNSFATLAVTTRERVPALPDVPAISETYPGFESLTWYGLFAPAGTPAPIIARVNQIVTTALQGGLGAKLREIGITPRPTTPQQAAQAVIDDTRHWRAIVERVGVRLD
ncbi:tripartite tricarboxylate transporter substrate binding protein [Bordetella bronchiseptica]|uniref:tripartite tricarboxylate transporter substrate binding protein n=2 Tax=Bordetella bronchiseptica TaxID=518 RepID=UPI00028A971B|nr:tripartite tricarboxylate transporter substrate binding protein [Bordetella bronchiseptica]KDD50201.1 tripartite tricarboxylate transporter family receptor [Bordetella bronchiseptica OSU553]AUL14820.1 hypothetical protein BTL45_07950 [Bordetella bronchiseptica]AWP57916.1 hypothetical protein B7P02_07900 [Bordetella bronchiseptica]AWQ04649.1 hypothetical protein B9G73_07860 [Bordetella bronchiseptica]AZW30214.1 tripartite tricarboxylate transporter substrate binding protein [Bordetella bronc